MRLSSILIVSVVALAAGSAAAQDAPAAPAAPVTPVVVGAAQPANVLREGTEISLRTTSELSSKESKVGDRFQLEVAEPVRLNGQVVIPAGTVAMGEVTKVDPKGMFGKSGKLDTRLLFVKLGDQQVRIRGKVGDRGKGGTAATVGSVLFLWPAAFFVTGTSAIVPPGSAVAGYLEADLPIVFAEPTPSAAVSVPAPVETPMAPAQTPAATLTPAAVTTAPRH